MFPSRITFTTMGITLTMLSVGILSLVMVLAVKARIIVSESITPANANQVVELEMLTNGFDVALSVAFSPDGTTLASGSEDGKIHLWNVKTGEKIAVLKLHTGWVTSIAFSPDGTTLASVGDDGTLLLSDVKTGQELATLEGHAMGFSPNGTLLAYGRGRSVQLWNVSANEEHATMKGPTGEVTSIAFSPDGTQILTGSHDFRTRLWDVETGELLDSFSGQTSGATSVEFSPDGAIVASASEDGTIFLWNAPSHEKLPALKGHTGWASSVEFSPNGAMLASASYDGTIRLWDVRTSEELAILEGHTDWIDGIAFSQDGTTIASASEDGTIRLWGIPSEALAVTESAGIIANPQIGYWSGEPTISFTVTTNGKIRNFRMTVPFGLTGSTCTIEAQDEITIEPGGAFSYSQAVSNFPQSLIEDATKNGWLVPAMIETGSGKTYETIHINARFRSSNTAEGTYILFGCEDQVTVGRGVQEETWKAEWKGQ